MVGVSRGYDEGSNNNDNRVISTGMEREERPLICVPLHDTAEETPSSGSAVNPVSADDEVRIYKRIKFVMPLTGRLFGLSATGCVSDGNAFL